ncbi:hypothetical protein FCM35_KLT19826 [Carex littledalei]|uniref:Uncharacterized protein n=1 Tax=Carex littledalei TaxID=544730 RepID=A0A833R4X2_9POAL|nr:hypothetical protein FCM35_KLT19826 [Carex littledalei]
MATASGNELFDDLPPSPPPLPWVSEFTEESGYENLSPVPPLQTQMRTNPPDQEMETVPPSGDEPALKKSRTLTMRAETPLVSEAVEAGPPLREMAPPVSDTRDSEIRTKGTPSGVILLTSDSSKLSY